MIYNASMVSTRVEEQVKKLAQLGRKVDSVLTAAKSAEYSAQRAVDCPKGLFKKKAALETIADAVEALGVERSREAAKRASLAVLVLDGSRSLTAEDEEAMALAEAAPHLIVAANKSDLPRRLDVGALADRFDNVLSVSAATGEGLDALAEAIAAQFPAGETVGGALLTNARQADAANRALSAVAEARSALRIGMTADVVLTDCEAALEALGELNGKRVRDDLVETIFSRFCVGK